MTNRPTVLLLHSSASSPRQWQDLVDCLRGQFRVLALEFHGHGTRADWTATRPMRLADEAALALPLLEMAGGAHLVGHSYGAAVALKLANTHPRLVHSLVGYEPVLFRLLAGNAPCRREMQEVLELVRAIRDHIEHAQPEAAARQFVEFWSGTGTWQALPMQRQHAVAVRIRSVLRQFDLIFAEPLSRRELAQIDVPMMFLSGARSVASGRRLAQCVRDAMPLAEHHELPGMGHMGPITHPAQVNQRIRHFLRTQEGFAATGTFTRPTPAALDLLDRTLS